MTPPLIILFTLLIIYMICFIPALGLMYGDIGEGSWDMCLICSILAAPLVLFIGLLFAAKKYLDNQEIKFKVLPYKVDYK